MDIENFKQLYKDDRTFLHDLANKILVLSGTAELLKSKFEKDKIDKEEVLTKLERVLRTSDAMVEMIKTRREELKLFGEKENINTST